MYGLIKWFGGYDQKRQRNNEFGFIQIESGDVYFHKDSVRDFKSVSHDLSEGQLVELNTVSQAKGISADSVKVINDLKSLCTESLRDLARCRLSLPQSMKRSIDELLRDRTLSLKELIPQMNQWIEESTRVSNIFSFGSQSSRHRSIYKEISRSRPVFEDPGCYKINWEPKKTFECTSFSRLFEESDPAELSSFLESYGHVLKSADLNYGLSTYMNQSTGSSITLLTRFFRRLDDQVLTKLTHTLIKTLPQHRVDMSEEELLSLLKTLRSMSPLYHMTSKTNLDNILTHGLLSHHEAHRRRLVKTDISMAEVQSRRSHVHGFVPLYFNPRNAMLFKRREQSNDIVMIAINPMILLTSNLITDGNAASGPTHAFKIDSLQSLKRSLGILDWSAIMSDSWNHDDPSIKAVQKRKICSEALIANTIPTHMIEYIGANCDDTVDEIESRCSLAQVISVHAPNLYFDNSSRRTSLGSFYNRRR